MAINRDPRNEIDSEIGGAVSVCSAVVTHAKIFVEEIRISMNSKTKGDQTLSPFG